MSLARHEWGDASLPPLVCLHGVTSHGRHFERLATRLADRFHVVALDLRGHGASSWEPPWQLEQHVADVLEATAGYAVCVARALVRRPCRVRGRGSRAGARRAARAARSGDPDPGARRPLGCGERTPRPLLRLVRRGDRPPLRGERAHDRAARARRGGATRAPAPGRRRPLSLPLLPERGRRRLRRDDARAAAVRTGAHADAARARRDVVPSLRRAGRARTSPRSETLLEVVRIPAGHTLLWDALDDTAAAVERFL